MGATLTAQAATAELDAARDQASKEADKLIQTARTATQKAIEDIEAGAFGEAVKEQKKKELKDEQKNAADNQKKKAEEDKECKKHQKKLADQRKNDKKVLKAEERQLSNDEKQLKKALQNEEKKAA